MPKFIRKIKYYIKKYFYVGFILLFTDPSHINLPTQHKNTFVVLKEMLAKIDDKNLKEIKKLVKLK